MKKSKEIIICIISLVVLMMTITNVLAATPAINNLNGIAVSTNDSNSILNENENIQTIKQYAGNNTNENTTLSGSLDNLNINNSTNTPSELADTGIETSSFFIILICGISAIYAYKKIKDYKNI